MTNLRELEAPDKATPAITGELRIARIEHNPESGDAIVRGAVGDTNFTAEITPKALQSYPVFQAEVFRQSGLWAICSGADDRREGRERWNDYVWAVMRNAEGDS